MIALHRLGWAIKNVTTLVIEGGRELDLNRVCPITIKHFAQRCSHDVDACRTSTFGKIGGQPDYEPLADAVRSKQASFATRRSLKALGEGGWITQYDMYE